MNTTIIQIQIIFDKKWNWMFPNDGLTLQLYSLFLNISNKYTQINYNTNVIQNKTRQYNLIEIVMLWNTKCNAKLQKQNWFTALL